MKIIDCIVCEDIRREIGGKHSLMGVYDRYLLFPVRSAQAGNWPKLQQLSLFIRMKREEGDSDDAVYAAVDASVGDYAKEIARIDISKRQQAEHIHLVIMLRPFSFVSEGIYTFNLRILDAYQHSLEKKENIYSLIVKEQVIDQRPSKMA